MKALKIIGLTLLYLFSGALIFALFTGLLWITNGYLHGYPAFGITFAAGFGMALFVARRELSLIGKMLRMAPLVIAFLLAAWSVVPLKQFDFPIYPDDPRFEMWDLGGDRTVSVSQHLPSENTEPREETILFIHGGPGAYVRDFDRDFISGFSDEGFRVVIYDQVGAGHSPTVDLSEYSHQGNVDDLKEVIKKIDTPVILFGQSYGAALATSFLADYGERFDVRQIIFTEPGPLPGADIDSDHPHFKKKTTKAENVDGLEFHDVIRSPRLLLAMILPTDNRFVGQKEVLYSFGPDLQKKAVSNSYCREHEDQLLEFEHLPVNLLATMIIRETFMEAEKPDLRELGIPVLLLLGECSYVPRGFAMEYFDHYSISRSHLIRNVGHILWATPEGRSITHKAIMSFIDEGEMPLKNKPTYETRIQFIEEGL
ncbi:MAG: alpha/beta fold hydrolase [Balneolaceae bacterium]|nr:alpha/beta fold hydrolase [Balneolaceae bacterium]